MMNYCSICKEIILNASILRHDPHSKPVEQFIKVKYCPMCGAKLKEFPGWDNTERGY